MNPLSKIFPRRARREEPEHIPTPAETFLAGINVPFALVENWIVVLGDLVLSARNLERLPDLTNVIVQGSFYCENNRLITLKGAPRVSGAFICNNNELVSLEGAPQHVRGFVCDNNRLRTLEHAPDTVTKCFTCTNNRLTNLEHAPKYVGEWFDCRNNKLASLAGLPEKSGLIRSDFGEFKNPRAVPENLRLSPNERTKKAREALRDAVVLQTKICVSRPLQLRPRPAAPGEG